MGAFKPQKTYGIYKTWVNRKGIVKFGRNPIYMRYLPPTVLGWCRVRVAVFGVGDRGSNPVSVQESLSSKKQPSLLGPPWGHRHVPTVGP